MTTRSAPLRLPSLTDQVLAQTAQRIGFAAAARIQVGCLTVVLPDGSRRVFGDRASERRAEIQFHDNRALAHLLLHGETGAGESYVDGGWSSPDLPGLLELAALNRSALALSSGWWRVPGQVGRTLGHRARRNTRTGSRRNIAAHYDLSNELYRLFLDESMTYSSAVFETPEQSLADAQRNKYRLIAEGTGLRAWGGSDSASGGTTPASRAIPAEVGSDHRPHVLEIGSGWGGFALYAAGELGWRVTTITISRAQAELARERIRAAGLDHLVDVQLLDYREITGTYDAVVSIEMLEAVGAEYYAAFFGACDAALVPGGRLSLQSITFRHDAYEAQRRGANWIQQYIFPGGLVPSLAAIEEATGGTSLMLNSARDIGASYVTTLREWRTRFLEQIPAVRALGFDDRFIRMWEYYLALSEAGFKTGLTQDHQLTFEKRRGLAIS